MNLPPFYIGQKVVYITGLNLPKDSIWVVKDIRPFPCGCWGINIGLKSDKSYKSHSCSNHEKFLLPHTGYRTFCAESFRPLQESFEAITFSKILEQELTSLN